MTLDQFWDIIEKVHRESGGNMARKCKLLDAELRRLPLDEVVSFRSHFDTSNDLAYSEELWAAAYVIGHGCSDDSFSDFRSTLISMGRQLFELALADPQALADIDYDAKVAFYEGYQYVPSQVVRELGEGRKFPRVQPHPTKPKGIDWDEDNVAKLYPKLAAKYGFEN